MKNIFKSSLLLLCSVCLFAACADDNDSNPTLVKFMDPYDKALNEGTREELLCESFAKGLKVYADVFTDIKDTYNELCKRINESAYAIGVVNLFENIKIPYIKESLYDDIVAFTNKPSQDNRIKEGCVIEIFGIDVIPDVKVPVSRREGAGGPSRVLCRVRPDPPRPVPVQL